MDETVEIILEEAKVAMDASLDFLAKALQAIRAGKANTSMLDGIYVDYYGSSTPLSQVANVSVADPRLLTVTPWEKNMIPVIEKAIRDANLGFNPGSDGVLVRVPIPSLTEERRKNLVKQAKDEGEHARIGIRHARQEANNALKKSKDDGVSEDDIKLGETKVQDLTNEYNKKVEEVLKIKEEEIMTV